MRKVDRLGRIVIPMELRRKYGLLEGADVKFEDNGSGVIVKAAGCVCCICSKKISADSDIPLCSKCVRKVKEYNNEKTQTGD